MSITSCKKGVWSIDQIYKKISSDRWLKDYLVVVGCNNLGMLGLNDTANRSSPVQIDASGWCDVSACNHSLALKN